MSEQLWRDQGHLQLDPPDIIPALVVDLVVGRNRKIQGVLGHEYLADPRSQGNSQMVGVPVVCIGNVRPAKIAPTGVVSPNQLKGKLADAVAIGLACKRPLLIGQETQEIFCQALIQIHKSRTRLPFAMAQRLIRCRRQSHPGAESPGTLALGYELKIQQEQVADARYSIWTARGDDW